MTTDRFRNPDELSRIAKADRDDLAKYLGANAPVIIRELEMALEVTQPLRDAEDAGRDARTRERLAQLREAAVTLRELIEGSNDEIGRMLVISEIDKGMDAMPNVPKHPDPYRVDILLDTLYGYIAQHPGEDRAALSRLAVRAGEIESTLARCEAGLPAPARGAKPKEARARLIGAVGLVFTRHGIEITDSLSGPAVRTLRIVLAAANDHLSADAVRKLVPDLLAE